MKSSINRVSRGKSYPLGATLAHEGTNFAIYSEHASSVILCLFEDADGTCERAIRLTGRTGHIWHCFLEGVGAGQRYGYRVEGRWSPEEGHLFNPLKLLVDPYAGALEGEVVWEDPIFGYRRGDHPDLLVESMEDSSGLVPRSIVVDHSFDWDGDRSPDIPLAESVIYETHVKGMTALHPQVPPELRGTYAGFAQPAVTDHLRTLGVNAVELLPVQAFVDEEFLATAGLRNYWGYNTIGFFAPEPRYASAFPGNAQVAEFKSLVREMHRRGFEVFIDVVYNHTAEGGRSGPTLCFRGIDNRTYYRLNSAQPSDYLNYSGTGNTLNLDHPAVLRMVLDSLRTWVTEYHVDGFRFDLAPALGREALDFTNRSAFFKAVFQDPVLTRVKLFAEPWDIGPGGYQLGHFPAGWSEWNDRFRDTARSFWLGHHSTIGDFAVRMTGSVDLYGSQSRGPLASVNYVTCHDGFTLQDVVSYDQKHNQANNEHNRDGHDHNLSNNFGVEGRTGNREINRRRNQARRNLIACTLFADGVPLLLGGDELSRSQQGNNNAYAQDNEINWYDWGAGARDADFEAYVSLAIKCRSALSQLRREHFRHSELPSGVAEEQPAWHEPDGSDVRIHDWGRQAPRSLQLRLSGNGSKAGDVLILFNAEKETVQFSLPAVQRSWIPLLDTSSATGIPGDDSPVVDLLRVAGESLILLADRNPFPG